VLEYQRLTEARNSKVHANIPASKIRANVEQASLKLFLKKLILGVDGNGIP